MSACSALRILGTLAVICLWIAVRASITDRAIAAPQIPPAEISSSSCPHPVDKGGIRSWKPTNLELHLIVARNVGYVMKTYLTSHQNFDLQEPYLDKVTSPFPNWRNEALKNPERANLCNADLSGADLTGAPLFDAIMNNADLSKAQLHGAYLGGATLIGADLSNADLSNANLHDAKLIDSNLSNATVSGADLETADLRNATLDSADLSGAQLNSADLSDAQLTKAKLTNAQLQPGEPDVSKTQLRKFERGRLDQSTLGICAAEQR